MFLIVFKCLYNILHSTALYNLLRYLYNFLQQYTYIFLNTPFTTLNNIIFHYKDVRFGMDPKELPKWLEKSRWESIFDLMGMIGDMNHQHPKQFLIVTLMLTLGVGTIEIVTKMADNYIHYIPETILIMDIYNYIDVWSIKLNTKSFYIRDTLGYKDLYYLRYRLMHNDITLSTYFEIKQKCGISQISTSYIPRPVESLKIVSEK